MNFPTAPVHSSIPNMPIITGNLKMCSFKNCIVFIPFLDIYVWFDLSIIFIPALFIDEKLIF